MLCLKLFDSSEADGAETQKSTFPQLPCPASLMIRYFFFGKVASGVYHSLDGYAVTYVARRLEFVLVTKKGEYYRLMYKRGTWYMSH